MVKITIEEAWVGGVIPALGMLLRKRQKLTANLYYIVRPYVKKAKQPNQQE